ncbi:MAG: hypothetical protein V4514_06685 [Pseudomonadota bacterium]|uniref:hypothetical protein n=1 Tax=Phenylobacterium sp. TaxID=1871053 RepID=UPI0025DAD105|nr:hypothetical protein [Phenylobacterium sp.]MBT9470444.1 hypothetical protein [Phenylobacterium sp.]
MKFVLAAALALFATQAAAQDTHVWSVETPKDADAALRYAIPDTDAQPIAFVCVRKSGQVKVFGQLARQIGVTQEAGGTWLDKARVRGPWPMSVALSSEAATSTLRGQAHADETTGGTLAIAEFSTAAPVAAAFRKTGLITLKAAGETVQPPPAPKSMVRKFLSACK